MYTESVVNWVALHRAEISTNKKTARRICVRFTTLLFQLAIPDRCANNNFEPYGLAYRYVQFLGRRANESTRWVGDFN